MKFLWFLLLALSALLFIQTAYGENEENYQTVAKTLEEEVIKPQLPNLENEQENQANQVNAEVPEILENVAEQKEDLAQVMLAKDDVEAFKDQPEMVGNLFFLKTKNDKNLIIISLSLYLATFST